MPPKSGRKYNIKKLRGLARIKRPIEHHFQKHIYHFKRGYSGGILIPSTVAVTQFFAYTFSLSQVVNASEFTNLFDQFRINKIVLKYRLVTDPANYLGNNTGIVPRLFWFHDYDDATAPASLNEMRERPKCKIRVLNPYKPIKIAFTPSVLVTGYESGVSSMYMPKFKQWIDMADSTTQHFSIKFAIDQFANNISIYNVEIEPWFYFSCRNVR